MEYFSCDEAEEIITMEDDEYMFNYTPSDASLDTEVVSSNHFESAASMQQRLCDLGFMFVDRSIVKLGRQIGRGGQGTVYEASVSWPYMDKATKMAVKKFNSKRGISQGQYPLKLWTTEHLHVLRPRAFFIDDDSSLSMIMPLFSGDLRSAIDIEMKTKSGPHIEDAVALSIIMQLAMRMKVMHSVGVCHRDLKAANILLTSFPTPEALQAAAGFKCNHLCYIADFEVSENVKGTAFWRAPEVLMSLRTGIPLTDLQWQAADVYSFGMVCYEIVTGEIPFENKRFSDYDIVINGGRPELPEYIPEVLRKIILDCWHSNPKCRPDFCEILEMLRPEAAKEGSLASILSSVWEQAFSLGMQMKSQSTDEDLMQLRGLVSRHYFGDRDAILSHGHYACWGIKFLTHFDKFKEEVSKEHHTYPSISFVDYLEVQRLEALMMHTLIGFITTMDIACDTEQHLKDGRDRGSVFFEEKLRMGPLALKLHEVPREAIQRMEMKEHDNDWTLKEKLKAVENLVMEVKDDLDETATFHMIDKIFVNLDPEKTNLEAAISRSHMEFVICRTIFEKKHKTLLATILGGIMMFLLFKSSYFHSFLSRVFGVMISDSYGIFLWFLFPILEILISSSTFRSLKYYYIFYFSISLFATYKVFRTYGFRQLIGWIGFRNGVPYILSLSYTLLVGIHEYFHVKLIRLAQSFLFVERKKTKEE